jgi:hypothetical protein
MKSFCICAWSSAALAALVFLTSKPPTTVRSGEGLLIPRGWLVDDGPSLTPKEHRRAPDQTFLTYPEWFLVFGPAEYAVYLQHHTSSRFPFMTHVFQAWESYQAVDDQTHGVFPPNDEYHTMIKVINTSSTIEFGLKAAYETVIGRITDIGDGEVATDEDRFNATYARDYVKFLDLAPWYEFDFIAQTRRLWSDSSALGSHPLRKWERRYFLTTELLVKASYGKLIKLATKSAYDTPSPVTAVIVDRQPDEFWQAGNDFKVLSTLPNGSTLATLPRYTPFTALAIGLAKQGIRFQEVAGNRTAILITALGSSDRKPTGSDLTLLFSQPLPTKPGESRWAVATPVKSLHDVLRELEEQGLVVEHVFDY